LGRASRGNKGWRRLVSGQSSLSNLLLVDLFLLLLDSLWVVGWEEVDLVHHLPGRGSMNGALHDNRDQRVQKRLGGEEGGVDHGRGSG